MPCHSRGTRTGRPGKTPRRSIAGRWCMPRRRACSRRFLPSTTRGSSRRRLRRFHPDPRSTCRSSRPYCSIRRRRRTSRLSSCRCRSRSHTACCSKPPVKDKFVDSWRRPRFLRRPSNLRRSIRRLRPWALHHHLPSGLHRHRRSGLQCCLRRSRCRRHRIQGPGRPPQPPYGHGACDTVLRFPTNRDGCERHRRGAFYDQLNSAGRN